MLVLQALSVGAIGYGLGIGAVSLLGRQLLRLGKLSRMYVMDKPFTGLIKESILLCGLDISNKVIAPGSAVVDAAQRQALKEILISAGVPVA